MGAAFVGYRPRVLDAIAQAAIAFTVGAVDALQGCSPRARPARLLIACAGAALVVAGAATLHLLSVRESPVAGPAEGSDVPPGGVA